MYVTASDSLGSGGLGLAEAPLQGGGGGGLARASLAKNYAV